MKEVAPFQAFGRILWREKNEFLAVVQEATCGYDRGHSSASTIYNPKHGDHPEDHSAPIKEAIQFIKHNPVVFGQFTKEQAAEELRKLRQG